MNEPKEDLPFGKGWSITVGELREKIADLPDEYEVLLDNAEVDDCEIASVGVGGVLPPHRGSPGLLILNGGQVVSAEYDYGPRLDAHLGTVDEPEEDVEFTSMGWTDRPFTEPINLSLSGWEIDSKVFDLLAGGTLTEDASPAVSVDLRYRAPIRQKWWQRLLRRPVKYEETAIHVPKARFR